MEWPGKNRSNSGSSPHGSRHGFKVYDEGIIRAGEVALEGELRVPEAAVGLVMFVHGSGSSRFSPRDQYVARVLDEGGLDYQVIELNRVAAGAMRSACQPEITDGATHLFEEPPGKLEEVAARVRNWFLEQFTGTASPKNRRAFPHES